MSARLLQRVSGHLWSGLWAEGGRRLVAAVLALFVLVLLLGTLTATGVTDDDDFYAPAGIAYAAHTGQILSLDLSAWRRASVDRAYDKNKEHPPFAKWVMGVCYHLLHRATGLLAGLDAARVGVVLFAAALAYLLASFAHAWRGPVAAVVAVLALFGMPRFFFHAHVATLDVPVAAMYFATAYAFWRGRESRGWAVASGVVFGLAMLTKLNAPFAIVPIVVFVLLERWRGFRCPGRSRLGFPDLPLSLLSMIVLGPVCFVALWPHLWFDTVERLGAYLSYHLNHYPIYMYYLGVIYDRPFAPWHTPFVMAYACTPLILVGAAIGGVFGLRQLGRFLRAPGESAEGARAVYVLLHLLTTIGVVAFLGSPKYGGVKLFLPFFPFLALLIAVGVDGGADVLIARLRPLRARPHLARAILGGAVVIPALVASLGAHPFGLSYYGAGVGGLRGATAIGFERQYYDVADKELAAWLNAHAARGATLHFEPNNKEYIKTYRWLARDGYLRSDLRVVESASADLLVLCHERRWASYPDLAARWAGREKLYEKRIDGVPLYSVYRGR